MMALPITAELLGDTRIRCGAITLRHRAPIFALARRLLATGADSVTLLAVHWASTGTVSIVEPLGKVAKLDLTERDNGQRGFAPYRPREAFPSHPVAAEMLPEPESVE